MTKRSTKLPQQYGIAPTQIVEWKKHLLAEGSSIYQSKRTVKATEAYEDISCLQQQIGKLTVQVDWLKKSKELSLDIRRGWIDDKDVNLSLNEQLDLSRVSKTAYYYSPIPESAENLGSHGVD